jgi:hypothetical protein
MMRNTLGKTEHNPQNKYRQQRHDEPGRRLGEYRGKQDAER